MTPQAFSYATIGNNGMIYCPPYGLNASIDFMIKINPVTFEVTKIPLTVDGSNQKWIFGSVYENKIIFFPYNESSILILNTDNDSVEYVPLSLNGLGKFIKSHVYKNKVISLPYGEFQQFDHLVSLNIDTNEVVYKKIECPINDNKKWHTSQILNGKLYAAPRGERWSGNYFPYAIEVDCETLNYNLTDLSNFWKDYDDQGSNNHVKYTTLAKSNNKLYAPPYGQNPNFDVKLTFDKEWNSERINIKHTSRKYFNHTVASNGKIYFPPAGHDSDWSQMLIINSIDDSWKLLDLNLGKESKKYFTGNENSKGKIYYIPRGGCVCEPTDCWKMNGDLTEILVIDSKDDSFYTLDISEYFTDNTTIEKYNCSVIIDDKIFALPYGQSETFQTVLVFDTLLEKVIHTIDLNDL